MVIKITWGCDRSIIYDADIKKAPLYPEANGGVSFEFSDEDEFGNTTTYKVSLDPDDIKSLNEAKL